MEEFVFAKKCEISIEFYVSKLLFNVGNGPYSSYEQLLWDIPLNKRRQIEFSKILEMQLLARRTQLRNASTAEHTFYIYTGIFPGRFGPSLSYQSCIFCFFVKIVSFQLILLNTWTFVWCIQSEAGFSLHATCESSSRKLRRTEYIHNGPKTCLQWNMQCCTEQVSKLVPRRSWQSWIQMLRFHYYHFQLG